MKFLRAPQKAVELRIDNRSCVLFATAPSWNGRTRHLSSRWWLLDCLVREKVLNISWCDGRDNVSDVMTKGVSRGTHKKAMGFVDLVVG